MRSPFPRLRLVQLRSGMLFARANRSGWGLPVLVFSLVLWLAAIVEATAARGFSAIVGVLLALTALGALAGGVVGGLDGGAWLSIDLHRGWVNWQVRRWRREHRENFAPSRIEKLQILRHEGLLGSRRGWELWLVLDHPRLRRVRIDCAAALPDLQQRARQTAVALGLQWIDEQELLHVPLPRPELELDFASADGALEPPPPEIHVRAHGQHTWFELPRMTGLSGNGALLFGYALLWCFWSWSCFLIQWRAFGDMLEWTIQQRCIMALVCGGSLCGGCMLLHALLMALSVQTLELRNRILVLRMRLFGITWCRRCLPRSAGRWIRRVDPPAAESGLWLPHRARELCVGRSLSAESLAWLQHLLAA